MPHSLDKVERILHRLAKHGIHRVDLLVVPGLSWQPDDVARLRHWQSAGHQLAGHGWFHRIERFGSLNHRLHGLLISRDIAEHLALTPPQRIKLMHRCHDWFEQNGLAPPLLYVPPAWALGNVDNLLQLPCKRYRWIETLAGVHDLQDGRFISLPLLGYEADTIVRQLALCLSNSVSGMIWRRRRPLRLSIHPDDFELRLGSSLAKLLALWESRQVSCLTLHEALSVRASA